ncbi:MAG: DEAD/DEAH box helicase [Thermoplasmata archaeon]
MGPEEPSPTGEFGAGGIDPRLVEAVRRRGIRHPTEIQRLSFPLLGDSADDALLLSPTGTGKTEAALLPLLSAALRDPSPPIRLLYVTPLRALNRDLEHRLIDLAREVGLRAAVRHGDTPSAQRTAQSRRPPDLMLTTPETLQILLVGRRLREALRSVRAVIVDEVHELVPSDRGAQLALTLERLDAWAGRPVRRIGLSATVGNPTEVARFLSPPPRRVEIRAAEGRRPMRLSARTARTDRPPIDPSLLGELKADGPLLAILRQLEEEIRAHRTTLVFVNTRPTAEGIGARLRRLAPDLPIAVHHGSLSREVREEAEEAFRQGRLRALIATSSLELGIDVGEIDHVVQVGSPHQVGRLVQRVGRSGHRLDRTIHGTVMAFDDDDLEEAAVLCRRAIAGELEPIRWRPRNRLAIAQHVVAALRAEGTVERADLLRVVRRAAPAQGLSDGEWGDLLDYLEGLGLVRRQGAALAPGRGTLDRFYATLSLIPEERTYRLRDIGTRQPIGTLDERFVLTQILAQPEEIFLLHGRTWRVVEHREDELLVEAVNEIGQEPRWVGEDLPVPFEVAREIGRLRRTGAWEDYPLDPADRERLRTRRAEAIAAGPVPDDRTIVVSADGRLALFGICAGTRTNETLSLAIAARLTERLGARVSVASVEPTSIVLELPVALDVPALIDAATIPPEDLAGWVESRVPGGPEYRWTFLTVARKFGLIPRGADPRDLKGLEPLLEASRQTPLGDEALEKTLHDRHDLPHALLLLEEIRDGTVRLAGAPRGPHAEAAIARLRWRVASDTPPPTLLRALRERLGREPITLVCLRCGFSRTITPDRYREQGGSVCRVCRGALSAAVSPRRPDEIARIVRYAKSKWNARRRASSRSRRPGRPPSEEVNRLIRAAYTSAELVAHYGERALWALAARGVGPETARRLLARYYRDDDEFVAELVRLERTFARTRAFWD